MQINFIWNIKPCFVCVGIEEDDWVRNKVQQTIKLRSLNKILLLTCGVSWWACMWELFHEVDILSTNSIIILVTPQNDITIDSFHSFFALLYVGILKLFTGSGSTVFTPCHRVPKLFPLLPFLMLVFSPKLAVKLFNKVNYSIKYFRSLF